MAKKQDEQVQETPEQAAERKRKMREAFGAKKPEPGWAKGFGKGEPEKG